MDTPLLMICERFWRQPLVEKKSERTKTSTSSTFLRTLDQLLPEMLHTLADYTSGTEDLQQILDIMPNNIQSKERLGRSCAIRRTHDSLTCTSFERSHRKPARTNMDKKPHYRLQARSTSAKAFDLETQGRRSGFLDTFVGDPTLSCVQGVARSSTQRPEVHQH